MNVLPKSRKSVFVTVGVLGGLLLILGSLVSHIIPRRMVGHERNEAITDAINLYKLMTGFALENEGFYPNRQTAQSLDSAGWETAEECFTQLLLTEGVRDESIFWNRANHALGVSSRYSPTDNDKLEVGENVWGYVRGLTTTETQREIPLFFDSSVKDGIFDTSVWEGRAIVARVDGSIRAMDIDYGAGAPFEEDGSSRQGIITENRQGAFVDIFTNLPDGAVILVPGGKPTP